MSEPSSSVPSRTAPGPSGGPAARPFDTVLVAARGEIACRIIRTLRRLGIRSVAVWSDADRDARHVREADVAVRLGPAAPAESYLSIAMVVAAARSTGAQAVHPGYGFLAENAGLATALAEAGIVFVGPGTEALHVMGDKIRARAHVEAIGVGVVPGVADPGLSDDELVAAAEGIGYPVLVKPSAGGGGKGMHIARTRKELVAALPAARRVASAAFGDDALFLERFLRRPRHIEVQVLADSHGNVVHLGERECSLQRRHQKIIEESPSPLLDERDRGRMGEAACTIARSIGYVGAGTVELLVEQDDAETFFFMEMNTRLQVEHPVTELVTGLDLVELQLRVAAGERLGLEQGDVALHGHAVEARLYAEDPAHGFLPATGTVLDVVEPSGPGVRVDSALLPGLVVTADYDPMLAKVVAWGEDRTEALDRLDRALAGTVVLGVPTNLGHLRDLLADQDVRAGRLDTGLVERRLAEAGSPATDPNDGPGAGPVDGANAAAVAASLWDVVRLPGVGSAWAPDGWRPSGPRPLVRRWHRGGGGDLDVTVSRTPRDRSDPSADSMAWTVSVGQRDPVRASLRVGPPVELAPVSVGGVHDGGGADGGTGIRAVGTVEVAGVACRVRLARSEDGVVWVALDGTVASFSPRRRETRTAAAADGAADPDVRSPMPGRVVGTAVSDGDLVRRGQPLLTVEAMKMEHAVLATADGVVALAVRQGQQVRLDQVLATIAPPPGGDTPVRDGTTPPHEGADA